MKFKVIYVNQHKTLQIPLLILKASPFIHLYLYLMVEMKMSNIFRQMGRKKCISQRALNKNAICVENYWKITLLQILGKHKPQLVRIFHINTNWNFTKNCTNCYFKDWTNKVSLYSVFLEPSWIVAWVCLL